LNDLISDSYRRQQQKLHESPAYGTASIGFAPLVAAIIEARGVTQMLDYGSGKARLAHALQGKVKNALTIRCYDPAVPEFAARPEPMQMVVCIDVLEHIEPPLLDAVLDDLVRCTRSVGFFSVHTGPAVKALDDGRNAHLIQEAPEWWLPRFLQRFDLQVFQRLENGFYVLVSARTSAA
jgi:hypothetical protein